MSDQIDGFPFTSYVNLSKKVCVRATEYRPYACTCQERRISYNCIETAVHT